MDVRRVASLTFTDGSMVMDLARLRLGQRLLRSRLGPHLQRFSRYPAFAQQVRSASGGPIAERDIELMWAAVQHNDGGAVQHLTIQYIAERLRFEQTRWLPALAATKVPHPPVLGRARPRRAARHRRHLQAHVCPSARLTLLPRAGHFCQQEDPDAWNEAVLGFWS